MLYIAIGLILVGFGGLLVFWLFGQATKKKPICKYCGKEITTKLVLGFDDGSFAHHTCVQQFLDKQDGTCPVCEKPIDLRTDKIIVEPDGRVSHLRCARKDMPFLFLTSSERKELAYALMEIAGFGGSGEDVFWTFFDPCYGELRKASQKDSKLEMAKLTLDAMARKNFPQVKAMILSISQKDVRLSKLRHLLPKMTATCASCGKEIYSGLDVCPYCQSGKEQRKQAQLPSGSLEILKARYAKGQITKEEYEQMKKTLES